ALDEVRAAVVPGVSTLDLDRIAEAYIRAHDGIPSFLGYHGFTGSICTSVNDEVVHGIPTVDRVLGDGDLISIDCGAIVAGWHGDAAITVPVGTVAPELLELVRISEDAMWAGLAAARPGGRLSDVSHAIETSLRGHEHDYGIVTGYGGHGIGTEMHQEPHVLNHGRPGRGPRLVAGVALAIEPMVTFGRPDTDELDDGWTVVTRDGSIAAHVEHTVAVTEDGPWVTTAHDGGAARLAQWGLTVPARG
nr:type I methionyl aminopeptidase [Geodermatophilaceae bacterium]